MTAEREVLLVVHPDRDTTREAAREVSQRFAKAGIRLRVLDEDVLQLIDPDGCMAKPCTVVAPEHNPAEGAVAARHTATSEDEHALCTARLGPDRP
ncbi:hypothetical protein ABT279_41455, partial [Amycolatopsis sp. NPDC000673]